MLIGKPLTTARQDEFLNFIEAFIKKHGYSPTVREIANGMGLSSVNGVIGHLNALEKKGRLKRDKARARSIVLRRERDAKRAGEDARKLFLEMFDRGMGRDELATAVQWMVEEALKGVADLVDALA